MTDTLSQINNFPDLVLRLVTIGNVIIYVLVGLAIIYSIYAVVQYFIKGKAGDESRREAGMQILWGIVGLAIIISLWGLVNIITNTFLTNQNRPTLPNANFLNSNSGVQQYSAPIGPASINGVQQYSAPIGP